MVGSRRGVARGAAQVVRLGGWRVISESSTIQPVLHIIRNRIERTFWRMLNHKDTLRMERDIASAKWQHSKNRVSQYCTWVVAFGIIRKRLQKRFDFKRNYTNTCKIDRTTNVSSYPPKSHARAKKRQGARLVENGPGYLCAKVRVGAHLAQNQSER